MIAEYMPTSGRYRKIAALLNDIAYLDEQPDSGTMRVARFFVRFRLYILILGLLAVPVGIYIDTDFTTPLLILGGGLFATLAVLMYAGRFYVNHYKKGAAFYRELYSYPEFEWDYYFARKLPKYREWAFAYIKYGLLLLLAPIGVSVLFWFFLHRILFLSYGAFILLALMAIFFFRRGLNILKRLPKRSELPVEEDQWDDEAQDEIEAKEYDYDEAR